MIKLYFFRHGLATAKSYRHPDRERPLTQEGLRRVKKAARGLQALRVKPDLVLTSPLKRALQTAEPVAKALRVKGKVHVTPALAPEGSLADVFTEARRHGKVKEVLLVGHEPGMSRMVSEALLRKADLRIKLKKSGACCVEVDGLPPHQPGTLLWLLTSKQLRKLA